MGAAAEKLRMSEADYLDWESRAKEKHEYVAGEIFAMAGASERHNRIALHRCSGFFIPHLPITIY
jgi:Uma2 family endonuclease